jgi:hypothetical protein
MRRAVDYVQRAEECRRLARLGADRRDWGHFEEMAQTWELLAKLQGLNHRLKSSGILKTKPPAAVLHIENTVRDMQPRPNFFS